MGREQEVTMSTNAVARRARLVAAMVRRQGTVDAAAALIEAAKEIDRLEERLSARAACPSVDGKVERRD